MKHLIVFLVIVLGQNVWAQRSILQLSAEDGMVALYLENGEIVEFSDTNTQLKMKAIQAYEAEAEISIQKISHEADTPDLIADIEIVGGRKPIFEKDMFRWRRNRTPEPEVNISPLNEAYLTKFETYQEAQNLMDTFNGATGDKSQCYNRANMWTYEAAVKQRANLGKIWIFFTKKYTREYRYKWWFHIAPYTQVNDANEKYVLDRGFTMIPYNVTNWKDLYMENKAECPVVENYRDYEKNQKTEYCYLMYSSQFYWQPKHLKKLATRSQEQTNYWPFMLRYTYRDALIKWDRTIPMLGETPVASTRADRVKAGIDLSFRGANVGDQVVTSEGQVGTITELVENAHVQVQIEGEDTVQEFSMVDLAVMNGTSSGVTVGDEISVGEDTAGTVAGIYTDGSIALKTDGLETEYQRIAPSSLKE